MLDALLAPLDDGSIHFQRSNLEITSVDVGNTTTNVIPAKAVARFNVRFGDTHTLEILEALLQERVERAAGGARYELDFVTGASASFITEPGQFVDVVAGAVEAETGTRPKLSTAGGTSDARFIKDYCPVIEMGLVNVDHAPSRRAGSGRRAGSRHAHLRARAGAVFRSVIHAHEVKPLGRRQRAAAGAFAASSAALRSAALHRPSPTSFSEPMIERT